MKELRFQTLTVTAYGYKMSRDEQCRYELSSADLKSNYQESHHGSFFGFVVDGASFDGRGWRGPTMFAGRHFHVVHAIKTEAVWVGWSVSACHFGRAGLHITKIPSQRGDILKIKCHIQFFLQFFQTEVQWMSENRTLGLTNRTEKCSVIERSVHFVRFVLFSFSSFLALS